MWELNLYRWRGAFADPGVEPDLSPEDWVVPELWGVDLPTEETLKKRYDSDDCLRQDYLRWFLLSDQVNSIALSEFFRGNYTEALEIWESSLDHLDDKKLRLTVYHNLALAYYSQWGPKMSWTLAEPFLGRVRFLWESCLKLSSNEAYQGLIQEMAEGTKVYLELFLQEKEASGVQALLRFMENSGVEEEGLVAIEKEILKEDLERSEVVACRIREKAFVLRRDEVAATKEIEKVRSDAGVLKDEVLSSVRWLRAESSLAKEMKNCVAQAYFACGRVYGLALKEVPSFVRYLEEAKKYASGELLDEIEQELKTISYSEKVYSYQRDENAPQTSDDIVRMQLTSSLEDEVEEVYLPVPWSYSMMGYGVELKLYERFRNDDDLVEEYYMRGLSFLGIMVLPFQIYRLYRGPEGDFDRAHLMLLPWHWMVWGVFFSVACFLAGCYLVGEWILPYL